MSSNYVVYDKMCCKYFEYDTQDEVKEDLRYIMSVGDLDEEMLGSILYKPYKKLHFEVYERKADYSEEEWAEICKEKSKNAVEEVLPSECEFFCSNPKYVDIEPTFSELVIYTLTLNIKSLQKDGYLLDIDTTNEESIVNLLKLMPKGWDWLMDKELNSLLIGLNAIVKLNK